MGNTITEEYIYPQKWNGSWPPNTKNGCRRYIKKFTFLSDGSEEGNYLMFSRNSLRTQSGKVPSRLVVEKIRGNVDGSSLRISFNNENDDTIARLYNGQVDLCFDPGVTPVESGEVGGGSGDIVFSTDNTSDGDTFTLEITIRVKD